MKGKCFYVVKKLSLLIGFAFVRCDSEVVVLAVGVCAVEFILGVLTFVKWCAFCISLCQKCSVFGLRTQLALIGTLFSLTSHLSLLKVENVKHAKLELIILSFVFSLVTSG